MALCVREPVADRVAGFEVTQGKLTRTLALRERGGLVLLYEAPRDFEACRVEVGDGLTVAIRHIDLFLERENLTLFPAGDGFVHESDLEFREDGLEVVTESIKITVPPEWADYKPGAGAWEWTAAPKAGAKLKLENLDGAVEPSYAPVSVLRHCVRPSSNPRLLHRAYNQPIPAGLVAQVWRPFSAFASV